jgi:hypothetical protein
MICLRKRLGLILLFSIFCSNSHGQSVTTASLLEKTVELKTLYQPPPFSLGMFSSYDRNKKNQDASGFIRKEGDWYVIAEMNGPGAITRIWTPHPTGMIRIYLDDGGSPVIQQQFDELFAGNIEPFVKPFVHDSKGEGPHWSYIPIPYAKFCKVLVSELTMYQIEYTAYPVSTPVQSFAYPPPDQVKKAVASLAKQFVSSKEIPFKTGKNLQGKQVKSSIPAGETVQLASYAGPAVLRGMRINWGKGSANSGRDLLLKIYWDEETEPSVYAPVHDFFGSWTQTLALGREVGGTRYCYLPMPFFRNARIELENGNFRKAYDVHASFYIESMDTLPKNTRLFHAYWKRMNQTPVPVITADEIDPIPPCDPNYNYVALSAKGEGHVVGVTLYRTPSPESDTMIFVNGGEWPPAITGTGKEGFFDLAAPFSAVDFPLAGGLDNFEGVNCMTRLLIPAPIAYSDGISLTFEHGPSNTLNKDMATTVYWYQNEPHQDFPWMLPTKARYFQQTALAQPYYQLGFEENLVGQGIPVFPVVEAESLPIEVTGGRYEPQDMLPYGVDWSDNCQINFSGFDKDARIQFTHPPIDYSGWYKFDGYLSMMPDGSIVDIQVNRQVVLTDVLLYAEDVTPKRILSRRLVYLHASDSPRIDFIVRDKQADSTGYGIGVDGFSLQLTESFPPKLDVKGLYGLPGDLHRPNAHWVHTVDNDKLLLGYDIENKEPETHTLLPGEDGFFSIGDLFASSDMKEGMVLLTWKVQVDTPGLYRLDLIPTDVTPFALRSEASRIRALKRRVLVNGILVRGDDTPRFDPVTQSLLPYRFKIPLDKGENTLSMQIRCNANTNVQLKLYGLP